MRFFLGVFLMKKFNFRYKQEANRNVPEKRDLSLRSKEKQYVASREL